MSRLKNGKISTSQFTLLVLVFTIGSSILIAPSGLAVSAQQDAWLASILGVILSLPLIWLYGILASKFSNQSLFEYSEFILGKWLGKIVSLSFLTYFFILASLLVREIGDFLTTHIIPETPIQSIHFLFLLLVMMGTRLGIEVIARATEIFFPWILGLFTILILALLPEAKLENLKPIAEDGIKPILQGTFHFLGLPFLELVVFLMIYPSIFPKQKAGLKFIKGTLYGGIILIIINFITILVLGTDVTARNIYPSYVLAKVINIGDFLQRIEAFIAGIWFITIYVKITLCFYSTAIGLAQVLNLKDFRFLVYPLGMLLMVLSLLVSPHITYFQNFINKTWTPYSLTFGLFLPLILLSIATLKRK